MLVLLSLPANVALFLDRFERGARWNNFIVWKEEKRSCRMKVMFFYNL